MMTPAEDGFRMPGEFEKHACTWMVFPHRSDNWRNDAVFAQKRICELANLISSFEKVRMIVPREHVGKALKLLEDSVDIVVAETDDAWIRDTGATFVSDGQEVRGISWDFNAWGGHEGGLYSSWDKDSEIAKYMCRIHRMKVYETPGFVLEGGSIHVDGEGTCITTRECLLDVGRNPHMNQDDIDLMLKTFLNVDEVIWLDHGIVDDETNGHVDNMACFARPGEVILAWTDDTNHPQYERSRMAYDVLSNMTDAKGRNFIIHKIHIPDDMFITKEEAEGVWQSGNAVPRKEGDRLAASYINFITPNGALIFPTFGDATYDKLAEDKFKQIFPDRKVIGFYSRELLLGGGNIHCLTCQEPAP